MPAVAGSDQDGVDIGPIEQFPEITVEGAVLVLVMPVHELLAGTAPACLHVADRHALHVAQGQYALHVVSAPGTDADHTERDPFAGRRDFGPTQSPRRHDPRQGHSTACCQ